MGIIGNLINKVGSSKIGQKVFQPGGAVDIITKPIQAVGVIVSHPITTVTKGYGAAKQEVLGESVEKSIGKVLLNTGTVAAAVLTGGTAAGRTAATTIAKSLVPKTAKQLAVTAVAAPVAIGVISQTKKPLTALAEAPGKLTAFGKDVGTFIEDPTIKNAEAILKENPGVSIALGAGAVAAGAGALITGIGAVENIRTRESVVDLTKQLSTQQPTFALSPVGETPLPANPQVAQTPVVAQTQVQSSLNGKVRRRKRKSMRSFPSINQRVNVVVQNKNTSTGIRTSNKNYLKREIYA